jgi:uroporphyrin-III C-methyltransferase/precorrin-2 dehydrogenase/sirohydrochlorin ferrochelatase
MDLFPLFLKLSGRRVLFVGPADDPKRAQLARAGADVRVVDPSAFEPSHLDDAWLVVSAADKDINARVARAADARRVFVNAVDDPLHASAYLGGVVRRDGVTVAVSTSGDAPALAGLLREGLNALLPSDLARWIETAREERRHWQASGVPMAERRPRLLDALVALYPTGAAR